METPPRGVSDEVTVKLRPEEEIRFHSRQKGCKYVRKKEGRNDCTKDIKIIFKDIKTISKAESVEK